MRVEGVRGVWDSVNISANDGGKGRRRRNWRPLSEDRLRVQCAYGRNHLYGECARDQEIPTKLAGTVQRVVSGTGIYDVELYISDEWTGVLEPLGTPSPGKLASSACSVKY